MVKRWLKYVLVPTLLLLSLLSAGLSWTIWSPRGSSWLLTALFARMPVAVKVERIDGRLADGLRLEGLKIQTPEATLQIGRIDLDWLPARLAHGQLQVAALAVADIDLLLLAPPAAETVPHTATVPGVRPQLSSWPLKITAEIGALTVDRLTVRTPAETLWTMEHLSGSFRWDRGCLTAAALDLAAPEGTLSGGLQVDLAAKALAGDLRLALPEAIADVDGAHLRFDLNGDSASPNLRGSIETLLFAGEKPWIEVAATVALAGERLQVEAGEIRFPGHPDRIEVQGEVRLAGDFPWQATAQAEHLDLTELAGVPLRIYGRAQGEGELDRYRGIAELENRVDGYLQAQLSGAFAGDSEQIRCTELDGRWLGGTVAGEVHVGWFDDFFLNGSARGRDLDPERLFPGWPGRVNLHLQTELQQTGDEPLAMRFIVDLHDSLLHGKQLTGAGEVRLQGVELDIDHLDLHGEGLDLTARGRLSERLEFSLAAGRLSGVVPDLDGRADVRGWLRLDSGDWSGELSGAGGGLRYGDYFVERLSFNLHKPVDVAGGTFAAAGDQVRVFTQEFETLTLDLQGELPAHRAHLKVTGDGGRGELGLAGGYAHEAWTGALTSLKLIGTRWGDWALEGPAKVRLAADSVQLAPLQLASAKGEHLAVDGLLQLVPLDGVAQLRWSDVQLSHAEPWLDGAAAQGTSAGDIQVHWRDGKIGELHAEMKAVGTLRQGRQQLELIGGGLDVTWDQGGVQGALRGDFGPLGTLAGTLVSPESPHQGFPQSGHFSLQLTELSLAQFSPWLASELEMQGTLSSTLAGGWSEGGSVQMLGRAEIGDGRLRLQTEDGEVLARLQRAELDYDWRDDRLIGQLQLELANHGELRGELQLPLASRPPFALAAEGPVRGGFRGQFQEQGLLTSLFPGAIREAAGQLDFDWTLAGSWGEPDLQGNFNLSGAGGYLPAVGIQLENVGLRGHLATDRIVLDSFSMQSGAGRLEGNGEVRLGDWRPQSCTLQLQGKNFELIRFPELQLAIDPELQLSLDSQKLQLRGQIAIPEALIAARNEPAPVVSSPDVVIVDVEDKPPAKALPVQLDALVRVTLGKHVLIKAHGVDARLGGEVELQATSLEEVLAQGKLQVVEGAYSAYGIGLDIDRGNVFFAGGPVDRPTLDILALRTIGEVKAGVQVSGTPRQPVAKLYSEPMMADTDILAYIVLGRPLGSDSGQIDLLMTAAGVLLSKGESTVLQDRLKRRFGLDVLELQSGGGDVTGSVVTIGKYLSPKLYVSLGHALFVNTSEFRLRYSLSDRWELESNVGQESGADLYYRLEFD